MPTVLDSHTKVKKHARKSLIAAIKRKNNGNQKGGRLLMGLGRFKGYNVKDCLRKTQQWETSFEYTTSV